MAKPNNLFSTKNTIPNGITITPTICHDQPVIDGTRVLISTVVDALAAGDSEQGVAVDYDITSEQISDALLFSSESKTPDAHKNLLDERRRRVADGEETLLDWDQVKDDLGKS